eukprot:UN01952
MSARFTRNAKKFAKLRIYNNHYRGLILLSAATASSCSYSYSLFNVKADDGIFSSMPSVNPMSLINAIKLETTGYGNQLLIPCNGNILSYKQSWGDYISHYIKIWNFREGIRELHISFDGGVSINARKGIKRELNNHININGGITPKQIVNIIKSQKLVITTSKKDMGPPEQNNMKQDMQSWIDYVNPNQYLEWKDFRLVDVNVVVYASKCDILDVGY